jgi:hypothetical protein
VSNKPNISEQDNGKSLDEFLKEYELKIKQATNLIPAPDTNDEDLKWVRTSAPNAIEWTVDSQYLNCPTTYQYYRQYQVIRDYFSLRCPICNQSDPGSIDCWGKSRMQLESEILLVWSDKYQTDICPKCHTTRVEFVQDGIFPDYNQLHGVTGMRSGKTATASIIASYFEHRLYNIHYNTAGGISQYLHQLPNQPFEIAFIASSDVQSQDTIWAHYLARRRQSPWLQRYIQWVKEVERNTPKLSGVQQLSYEEHDKAIENPHLNLQFVSINSNASGLAGRTRLFAYIDELSRFQNSESRLSADEAYRVLENSLATARAAVRTYYPQIPGWMGSMISISSPISVDDKSMRLLKQAPEIKKMYAFHYQTWEFNPFMPREFFNDDFIKDPLGAERDFGANPPNANNPLIDDYSLFKQLSIDKNLKPTAQIEYYIKTDGLGTKYKAARCERATLNPESELFICFDAGLTFDTFGGAAAHGEWWQSPDGPVWITVFDWISRILPQRVPDRMDVWFDSILNIIKVVSKNQRIARVEFDRWNSAHLIQSIRDMSIAAEQCGTTVQDFVKFVSDAFCSKVRMLPPIGNEITDVEPHMLSAQATAIYELSKLERSPNLSKVFNPNKGVRIGWNSDDVAQCVVHVHKMVQSVIGDDVSLGMSRSPEKRLKRSQSGAASWSRGSGGAVFHPRYSKRGW